MNVMISCKQSFESKRLVTSEQEPFFKMKSVCYILASTSKVLLCNHMFT